jgi:hypothetical protein
MLTDCCRLRPSITIVDMRYCRPMYPERIQRSTSRVIHFRCSRSDSHTVDRCSHRRLVRRIQRTQNSPQEHHLLAVTTLYACVDLYCNRVSFPTAIHQYLIILFVRSHTRRPDCARSGTGFSQNAPSIRNRRKEIHRSSEPGEDSHTQHL